MSGRPDYDAGDLVVCVDDSVNPIFGDCGLKIRAVYLAEKITKVMLGWGVHLAGVDSRNISGFAADRFRKLDHKPPEFWTGEMGADAPQKVTA